MCRHRDDGQTHGQWFATGSGSGQQQVARCIQITYRLLNTFASSPLQAAVGNAVISVIEEQNLLANVTTTGEYLRTQLKTLARRCEKMGDVRGHGLFCGVDWVEDAESRMPDVDGAVAVVNALRQRGFLISNAGELRNVLKIRPPLVFDKSHADLFLGAFEETLSDEGLLAS